MRAALFRPAGRSLGPIHRTLLGLASVHTEARIKCALLCAHSALLWHTAGRIAQT
jgi:hypothetical protein